MTPVKSNLNSSIPGTQNRRSGRSLARHIRQDTHTLGEHIQISQNSFQPRRRHIQHQAHPSRSHAPTVLQRSTDAVIQNHCSFTCFQPGLHAQRTGSTYQSVRPDSAISPYAARPSRFHHHARFLHNIQIRPPKRTIIMYIHHPETPNRKTPAQRTGAPQIPIQTESDRLTLATTDLHSLPLGLTLMPLGKRHARPIGIHDDRIARFKRASKDLAR